MNIKRVVVFRIRGNLQLITRRAPSREQQEQIINYVFAALLIPVCAELGVWIQSLKRSKRAALGGA